MATNLPGIDSALAAQYSDLEWRLLTHPRSLARGIYRRGENSFTTPQPLAAHLKTATKDGFVLVEVVDAAAAFSGPWVADVQ